MTNLTKIPNAEWTVKKSDTPKIGGSAYVLRNEKTGEVKTVSSSAQTVEVMALLAKEKAEMLKRLADR